MSLQCLSCKEPPAPNRARCEKHLASSRQKMREYVKKNREKVLQHKRDEYARNKVKRREWYLQNKYGISLEEYEEMLVAQDFSCAICQSPESHMRLGKVVQLSIDHCHETGKVRGLLCNTCNRALGLLEDDAELLDAAALYLRTSVVEEVLG